MAIGEEEVRAAFARQEGGCLRLGSPFTARLCAAFAQNLDRSTAIGRRILDWPGEPDALHDAVPLRIAGGLHALVRRGRLPGLARLYPPAALPEIADLWAALPEALSEEEAELGRWLDGPRRRTRSRARPCSWPAASSWRPTRASRSRSGSSGRALGSTSSSTATPTGSEPVNAAPRTPWSGSRRPGPDPTRRKRP